MEEKKPKTRKTVAGRIIRILFKTILILILLFATVALLILTPPVQNFARKKAATWLSNKLKTKVEIGKIYIGFPKKVVLENVYIEDQNKDTLLSGGELKVNISMLKLLHSQIEVNQLQLSSITAKVKRILPDTIYNYQFIADAFAPDSTAKAKPKDSSSMNFSIKAIDLDKIRLVYNDAVTGNDMTLWLEHFDTRIDVFNLDSMRFNVPETNVSGIHANIYQHKPLVTIADVVNDTVTASPPPVIDFNFDKFNLSDINIDYGNDVSAFYTRLNLGKLLVTSDNVDLKNQTITLREIQLNNTTAIVRLGKKESSKLVVKQVNQEVKQQKNSGWTVRVRNFELNDNNIAFANDNDARLKRGMDYSHLDAKGITIHADNFIFTNDSIGATITKGQLSEQSGFQLNALQTEFLYASNRAYLHNLLLETPGTSLKRSVDLQYPSLDALKKDIGQMGLNLDLNNCRIQIKDILTFAPFLSSQPAFSNPSATWLLNGSVSGNISNMNIQKLQFRGFSNTILDIRGTLAGLPDAKKLKGNLIVGTLSTSRKDIQMLAPKGSLPSNITLPETLRLNGTIAGSMDNARGKLNLTTSLGNASVNGTISHPTDKKKAKYNATLQTSQLNLGVIMQNDSMYGPLTATVVASGTGFDLKTATANINATIISAVLNRYNYKDVKVHAGLASQKANVYLDIRDPNISLNLNGTGDLSAKYPALTLNAVIDSISTLPLHFTTGELVYRGNINADFRNTDPANPDGQLLVTKSVLTTKDESYVLDTIALNAGKTDTGNFVKLRSDAINLLLTGHYNLAQLGSVFQQAIQPYYAMGPSVNKDTVQDYDFRFNGQIINGPLMKVFAPTLTTLEPVKIQGRFASRAGWQTNVDAPLIVMGTNRIQKLRLNAGTSGNAIKVTTEVEQFSTGTSMNIYATTLNAQIAENKINFLLNVKDIRNKNKYRVGGLLNQPQQGIYAISLSPDSLLLNYDKWNISNNNIIDLNKGDIHISNFVLSKRGQELSINSTAPYPNAPVDIRMKNFRIGTITGFAKQDSALVDGVINGQILVKDIPTLPTFTSDLNVTDLMFRKDTVGNLAMKVSNTAQQTFNADITLTGKGNDIAINGNYQVKPANQSAVDLNMDIRKLQMTSIQAFSMGAISRASGSINGKFKIAGTFEKPDVNGALNFDQAGFTPSMLGSYFTINKQSILVNNQGVNFNSFTILDSSKNELILDGNAYTTNFINYKFDLDLSATNFQALNSTKQNSKLFYGQFYFDTDLHISGTEFSPRVDGNLTVNDKTKLTVVLPQTQPGVEEREGVVRFVDMDEITMDTTVLLAPADSLVKSSLKGMDVSVNIEVVKAAELTLIVDEGNGDFLRMKGTAQLTGGIDPSGKVTLTGSYEIEEGAYQLSLNFLQRKFEIQKGSKIVWLGEPTRANVNVTAVYVANTAPLTLVENQLDVPNLNIYKQKLPFNVQLILTGELLKPTIQFDISLPADKSFNVDATVIENVTTRLTQIKSEPSELNKQVFALLLLGRFVSENPFASSGGGGFNAATMARQSVSKLLTEQLNNLAADLISGVNLNFDVASTEDYTTGQMQNRTDLNVSLSKQLLNDRLKVTVGSNFELEGPQQSNQRSNNLAGNVALDYVLSKDGRYMIRAYRKNDYAGELDGYIIETGLKFILSFDYDHIRELFQAPKEKKARRRKAKNIAPAQADARKAGPVPHPVTN